MPEFFENGGVIADGQGDGLAHITRPALGAGQFPGITARAVFMVAGQHFIARLQVERTGHHVDAKCGVVDKDKFFGAHIDIARQRCTRFVQGRRRLTTEKAHGLALQLPLPLLVNFEDWQRRGPKRTVVEENHTWVKLKITT